MIIICNLCFRQKSTSTTLFLTNCQHVFCENCIFHINKKCFVCSKTFESIKIDSNMPPALRLLFAPLDVEIRKLKKVQRFQMEQLKYYIKRKAHLLPKLSQYEKKQQGIRAKIQMVKHAIQQEQTLIHRLKEFNKNLTPNLSKMVMGNNITIFDDSPELLRSRNTDNSTTKTDSGYHRI